MRNTTRRRRVAQSGGTCPCSSWVGGGVVSRRRRRQQGGYKATTKNRQLLSRWRRGESIGFTAIASLKAKGLIPRTSKTSKGKKILGPKYR